MAKHKGGNWRHHDMEIRAKDCVYAIRRLSDNAIKFGKASNLIDRVSKISEKHGTLEILATMNGYTELEKQIHALFEPYCIRKEFYYRGKKKCFYDPPLKTEWYEPAKEVLEWVAANMTPYKGNNNSRKYKTVQIFPTSEEQSA